MNNYSLRLLKGGDPAALTLLQIEKEEALLVSAINLINSKIEAERIVTAAFVALWKIRASFTTVQSVYDFLTLRVDQGCKSWLRAQITTIQ